ncbi:hypothetical protein FRB93_010983 [Tulasnella sp. JGI-2019a]|nr:hypothetical protein FRB93_010983 [Tulasnella sp. JGI-2019a]
MTDDTRPEISFSGAGSEDATLFIQQVQKVAFAQGRHLDDVWRVSYLATCLRGAAMRWYFLLDDDETRTTWVLLCRRLLHGFPPPTAPIPAAAPSSIGPPSSPGASIASPALQGWLKIVSGKNFLGYVTRQMSLLDKNHKLPKDKEAALIVEIPPGDRIGSSRWYVKLINSIPLDSECKYLGIVDRDDDDDFGKATYLVQCSSGDRIS